MKTNFMKWSSSPWKYLGQVVLITLLESIVFLGIIAFISWAVRATVESFFLGLIFLFIGVGIERLVSSLNPKAALLLAILGLVLMLLSPLQAFIANINQGFMWYGTFITVSPNLILTIFLGGGALFILLAMTIPKYKK